MPVKQEEAVKWVINEDFLTLYWEKEKAWGNNCEYVVMVNENILSTTQRTYCTFSLKEEKESQFPFLKLTESECRVQIRVREEEKILAELETSFQTESMQTGKKLIKSRIMITDNPYHAVGDGKTMDPEGYRRVPGRRTGLYTGRCIPDRSAPASQRYGALSGKGRSSSGNTGTEGLSSQDQEQI